MRAELLFGIVFSLAASSCALRPNDIPVAAPDLDRTLTTYSYIEDGELMVFVVDTRATRERDTEPFIPLEIAIGNRSIDRLSISRESFTLADDQGNRFPCVGPKDLLQGYDFLDFDRRLGELPGIVLTKFTNFTRYQSMFSPALQLPAGFVASTVVQDAVTLPRFGYLIDFIYFPRPPGGVVGKKLELFLEAPELKDPVFVKFLVR